ncbi:MAG TPA: outer membrane lipoprotein carrier protein LolA [Bacteroidia bacterium]|nr:outer membrane lipoprotein carrier protein LolA [Bacteroidia bacterium]
MITPRKFLFTIAAIFFALNSFAQPPAAKQVDPNYDNKAKTILDDVSKTAKSYSSITASFSISLKKANGTPDVKNGSIIMKSGRYKILLENVIKGVSKKEEYFNDGITTWVFSEKDKEVTVDCAPDPNARKNENSISPNDIFTIHEKGFKYKFVKEETLNGKVVQVIDLFPEKPDKKNYHTVKLTIDKLKKQIITVIFMHKDQSTTTYSIKTLSPNLEVTDASFQFDAKSHPGVSVVDLRPEEGCIPKGK